MICLARSLIRRIKAMRQVRPFSRTGFQRAIANVETERVQVSYHQAG